MSTPNPTQLAKRYFEEASQAVKACKGIPRVLGLIASTDKPSMAYANATKQRFLDVGMEYTLEQVSRLDLEARILEANEDTCIHGVFIYFPVFGNQQDDYLRNLISFTKDIEAGSQYWVRKLYANDRLAVDGDPTRKAVLPCTPLAIVKLLVELSVYGDPSIKPGPSAKPLAGQTVTIFNRSEVIGRPLAVMMSNDGAEVLSFDEHGPLKFVAARPEECTISRQEALARSDIVITGVPSDTFHPIQATEIKASSIGINFSSIPNFSDAAADKASLFIPRVGPMTVAMCMRNTLRLFSHFHEGSRDE